MNQYLKPNIGKLQATIKHIVVLMLENRSFDNLLGWLYADATTPYGQQYEGLSYDLWNPLENWDADGVPFIEKVGIEKNGQPKKRRGKPVPNPVDYTLPNPDPGEGYVDTGHQLYSKYQVPTQYPPPATNMGFVQNYQNSMLYGYYGFGSEPTNARYIMKCYTPAQVPVLSKLARSFAVCDHYHCSVPSQTLPNRDFVHTATSNGNLNNHANYQNNARTIFNQIQDEIDAGRKDLSWGVFGDNGFSSAKDEHGKFGTDHFSLTRLIMTQLQGKYDENFGTLSDFNKRCESGNLPSYSFLEPNYGGPGQNDQHPPSDIRMGDKLIADIYNMVKSSPAFEQTLFIITYDEHGGTYDHVPPPTTSKNPDPGNKPGQFGFLFNRFGVRVPCVVVNPYIKKGLIARPAGYTPFDHASIIKTVQNCFNLKGYLTERDKAAPDFSCLLTLDAPRQDDIPMVKPLRIENKKAEPHVNELHRLIGKILEGLTGTPVPDDEDDLLVYIHVKFKQHLGGGEKGGA